MAKKPEAVDELLDALVWMRRKAKKREAVDDLVDALLRMRKKAKKKVAKRKTPNTRRGKTGR
jgi:ClpP class serine protease